jgi:hypothetical protein
LAAENSFCDCSGPISGATELKVLFYHAFQLLLQLNQVSCGGYNYWGRPACFARNCSSCGVASVPEVSVSISVALRGVKKFRVTTSLFKAADKTSALLVSLKFEFPLRRCAAFACELL